MRQQNSYQIIMFSLGKVVLQVEIPDKKNKNQVFEDSSPHQKKKKENNKQQENSHQTSLAKTLIDLVSKLE